jgi:hypothetical protein
MAPAYKRKLYGLRFLKISGVNILVNFLHFKTLVQIYIFFKYKMLIEV